MTPEERYRLEKRRKLLAEHKRRVRRRRMIFRTLVIIVAVIIALMAVFYLKDRNGAPKDSAQQSVSQSGQAETGDGTNADDSSQEADSSKAAGSKKSKTYAYDATDATVSMTSDQVTSTYALLVNVDDGTIVGKKHAKERISPASMTKILTVLVASEHLDKAKLSDKVTITVEETDYAFRSGCSIVGFEVDEKVTVEDLCYGTILPSGADAAVALADYVAGSQDAFVELMNAKLEELGISDTAHFTNCVGLYDENHYCTLYDMAVILNAAMDNDMAREFLSKHRYRTTKTKQHPEGIDISNLFLRRIEDKDCCGTVVCAKTGFVNESGNCAASYFTANDGSNYICVTGNAHSSWRCIYDHVAVYNIYAVGNTGYVKE